MNRSNQQGFTLIEVMITVVVIGILSAIALPAYGEYVKRAARNDAKAVLMQDALLMEQQFTLNNAYPATAPVGFFTQSPQSGTAKYTHSIDTTLTTASKYTLQAVPAQTDKCGTFTIDNTGLRTLVGNTATVAECWAN